MAGGPTALLPLEIVLYFNRIYIGFYFVFGMLMFFYKGLNLPYPSSVIIGEMCLLFVVCLVDWCRIFLASKGNKTERSSALMLSALIGILFVILGYVYFLAWQVYV